jgi:CheY-like chemotaxis protein
LRCLIVDDSEHFLVAASRLLERQGVAIVGAASTSAEALRSAEELHPDVTLVDVHLGEDSGFDLAKQLCQNSLRRCPVVILISARPEREYSALIAASPAAGFVRKGDLSGRVIRELADRWLGDHSTAVNDEPGR